MLIKDRICRFDCSNKTVQAFFLITSMGLKGKICILSFKKEMLYFAKGNYERQICLFFFVVVFWVVANIPA